MQRDAPSTARPQRKARCARMRIVLRTPPNAKNLASGGVIELRMGRVEKNVIMQNLGCAPGVGPKSLVGAQNNKSTFFRSISTKVPILN